MWPPPSTSKKDSRTLTARPSVRGSGERARALDGRLPHDLPRLVSVDPVMDVRPKHGVADAITIAIGSDLDIVAARQRGRTLATQLGYSTTDATLIATAISELARNIVLYARRGEIVLTSSNEDKRPAIVVVARDDGPGIPD